jgi:uncharacterized protein DUF6062
MPQQSRHVRLDEALALPGCPVCRMVLQRVEQSMESISYELVTDPAFRERVDAAWGFCNVHGQQWLEHAPPLGTAIVYEAVLGRIAQQLERGAPGKSGMGGLRAKLGGSRDGGALVPAGTCPLCEVRAEQEALISGQLLDELRTPAGRDRYASSDGLCVVHLDTALALGPSADALDALRSRMLEMHQQLREQLREIIRKHDYRYNHEEVGDERDAPHRAVRQVAGQFGLGNRRS